MTGVVRTLVSAVSTLVSRPSAVAQGDKLAKNAETTLGAADTSVRATSR
jgi:hypothetical protein